MFVGPACARERQPFFSRFTLCQATSKCAGPTMGGSIMTANDQVLSIRLGSGSTLAAAFSSPRLVVGCFANSAEQLRSGRQSDTREATSRASRDAELEMCSREPTARQLETVLKEAHRDRRPGKSSSSFSSSWLSSSSTVAADGSDCAMSLIESRRGSFCFCRCRRSSLFASRASGIGEEKC